MGTQISEAIRGGQIFSEPTVTHIFMSAGLPVGIVPMVRETRPLWLFKINNTMHADGSWGLEMKTTGQIFFVC